MHQSDEQLWNEAIKGNQRAWKELVTRYQALVYTVATRCGLSMSDASDCFQYTWTALWQHRKKLKDSSRISSWLMTTAKREAIRMSAQSRRLVSDDALAEHSSNAPLPDLELELMETQAQLHSGLALLGARCKKLLDLLFFAAEDYSYEQIAAKSGIAFNSLGPTRRRCLEQLAGILAELGYSDVRESL